MRKCRLPLPRPRMEAQLAGSGGQGIILAGLVLAEAAGIYDGREVAMVQSYGPEARGGECRAEIIISDGMIDYPLCTEVDLLLALTQASAHALSGTVKPDGLALVDADLVTDLPRAHVIGIPFTALARKNFRKPMFANVIALGAISEISGLVSRSALEKALLKRVPAGTEELNKRALALGRRLARKEMANDCGGDPIPVSDEDT
jgi:2-oxoglutarate ferredoxin oxidoreductase subunit gamma